MRILATNDDGIHARGLWDLVGALVEVGEVVVVAPEGEQSGVGTSVTLHQPLRARKIKPLVEGVESYCVGGTPADSVILALKSLIQGEVDLLFSGINQGANLGDDVLISGTVGAALQGYLQGLPSIALSVAAVGDVHFDAATRLAVLLARMMKAKALPREMVLNINLPNLPPHKIKGVEITHLGRGGCGDVIREGHDGRRKYYWIEREVSQWEPVEGTDIWAVLNDKISITPLHSDLTSHSALSTLTGLSQAILRELPSL